MRAALLHASLLAIVVSAMALPSRHGQSVHQHALQHDESVHASEKLPELTPEEEWWKYEDTTWNEQQEKQHQQRLKINHLQHENEQLKARLDALTDKFRGSQKAGTHLADVPKASPSPLPLPEADSTLTPIPGKAPPNVLAPPTDIFDEIAAPLPSPVPSPSPSPEPSPDP